MNRGPSLIGGPFRLPSKHAGSGGGRGEAHRPSCLCCIGPPDHAFERACAAVSALGIAGIGESESL